MNYVDGFVSPVPLAKKEAYIAMARVSTPIFKEFGALRVVECWGDDVPPGKLTSLPMAVKCEPDEVVVFSWIEWPNKAVRDDGMKKFMVDKRLEGLEMPYDGKRVIFGGFQVIMDA